MTFLVGLAVGVVGTLLWQFVVELVDIYVAERDREEPPS